MIKYLIVLFCILFYFNPAYAWQGIVVSISDGDTLTVLKKNKRRVKIRLDEIDAPEMNQTYGSRSKWSLMSLCYLKSAEIKTHGKDKYKRTLATVQCNGINANEEQVKRGMAWVYRHYSHSKTLLSLEQSARNQHIGLWADPYPIPPWDFRHKVQHFF
jgi:endonuclease YncB( thermonuclease family)